MRVADYPAFYAMDPVPCWAVVWGLVEMGQMTAHCKASRSLTGRGRVDQRAGETGVATRVVTA